jgi:hypothetical protein
MASPVPGQSAGPSRVSRRGMACSYRPRSAARPRRWLALVLAEDAPKASSSAHGRRRCGAVLGPLARSGQARQRPARESARPHAAHAGRRVGRAPVARSELAPKAIASGSRRGLVREPRRPIHYAFTTRTLAHWRETKGFALDAPVPECGHLQGQITFQPPRSTACHAEGRGFESLQPLSRRSPAYRRVSSLLRARVKVLAPRADQPGGPI